MTYNTKQKDLIIEAISGKTGDFSVKEICAELAEKGISQATVYRAIEKLETEGVLKKLVGSDGHVRYQYMEKCDGIGHCYLKCDTCGATEHVDCALLSGLVHHIENEHDFSADSQQIILNGTCKQCKGETK